MWAEGREGVCVSLCVTMRERERGNEEEIHTKWPNSLSCAGFHTLPLPRQKKRHHTCWRMVTPLQLPEQRGSLPVPVTRYLFPLTSGSNCLLNALWWNKCRVTYMTPVPKAQRDDTITLTSSAYTWHRTKVCSSCHLWSHTAESSWILRLGELSKACSGYLRLLCQVFVSGGLANMTRGCWSLYKYVLKHILRCYRRLCVRVHVWFCSYQDLTSSEKHEKEQFRTAQVKRK